MLSDTSAIATVAVANLDKAKQFYEERLGLTMVRQSEEELAFQAGDTTLFVYRSEYGGTNKATAVTFVTDEVEDLVRTLKNRGVTFEHYDLPGTTLQGDVHIAGSLKVAWFKDPDGNIFSLVTPSNTAEREPASASARSRA